jgi:hypothetical protein
MPHIIEFTGVPCCGKSTLSHKVANQLSVRGNINENQFELSHDANRIKRSLAKFFRAVKYCTNKPVMAFRARKTFPTIGMLLNYYYIMDLCLCEETVVLEQGFCQLVMSLYEKEVPCEEKIEEIINRMPLSEQDIVVFIEVTPNEIKDRMKKRSDNDQPYFSDSPDIDEEIEKAIMALRIMKRIVDRRNIRSITVENHTGKEDIAVQSIMVALEELENK